MKSNNIKYIEDSLKRYIKKSKDVSYSTALLVAFLITGFISYSSEAVQMSSTRSELAEKILNEKLRVSSELKEAEKEIKNIDLKIEKLMRRGRFWVKPLEDTYQIFFNFSWNNNSKNRNRTKFNFSGPEYSSKPSMLSSAERETYHDGIYYGAEGIIKNPLEFTDNIDFGANISPKKVEEKTVIPPTVGKTEVKLAQITAPALPDIKVTAPVVTAPTAGALVTPTAPSINVTAPGAITPLGQITITEIAPLNVNVATPTVSEPLSITAPTVQAPATPAGFTPRLITPPKAPTIAPPVINIPPEISYPGFGSSISDKYDFWAGGNSSTMVDQISITAGKFKATSKLGAYIKGYQGQAGISATSLIIERGTPTGTPPVDGFHSLPRNFFMGIRNSAFIQWEPGVEISWFSGDTNNQLIYMETATTSTQTLDKLNAAGNLLTENLYNEINSYKTITGLSDISGGATGINLHNNRATIYLGDSDTRYQATTTISGTRLSVFNNEGSITGLNIHNGKDGINGSTKQVVYFNTPDTSNYQKWIYGNGARGKINLYGAESIAMYYTSSNGNQQQHVETAFVNDGEINLHGVNSSGVMVRSSETLKTGSGFYLNKPINIYSDGSRGIYIAGNISNLAANNAIARVKIGEKKNTTSSIEWTDIENNITKNIESNSNLPGKSVDYVDNAIGIMYTNANSSAKIKAREISLEQYSKDGIGIYSGNGKLIVSEGNIRVNGGLSNIGLATKPSGTQPGGEIDYTGDITIGNSATGAMLAYSSNNKKIKIDGNLNANSKEAVSLYSEGGNIEITDGKELRIKSTGKDSIGILAKGGKISLNRATLSTTPNLDITGDGKSGIAIFSGDGGVINSKKINIKVKDINSGVAAIGATSKVDITGSILDYDGNGYAVYANDGGEIDISNGEIILRGNSTAMEIDKSLGTNPITFTNGKIKVMSNDVIVYNLLNLTSAINVSNIASDINTLVGTGITVTAGEAQYNKWKLAAVDGGIINIDDAISRTDAAGTNGDYFFKKFLGQRLKINVNANVTAKLTTAQADADYNKQVVGIEANSSEKASGNGDTQVNIALGKTIEVARTDGTDKGATGVFINYGQIENKGTISVEKDSVENNGAAGIYAVNGSKVENKGTVEVGGNQSIGILGMAYRLDNNNPPSPIVNEFGGKAGEGLVNITNATGSKVLMSGENAIGIYAENNNNTSAITDHLVVNQGEIEVGKSSGNSTAIGIYANGVAVKPESGKIGIGEKAIAIYALDSEIGEAGKDLGTVEFKGDKGIAIYLTGDQNKTKLNGTEITLANPDSKKENVGIFVDHTLNATAYETAVKVNTGASNNITAYYTKSGNLKVKADGKINENSTGITGAEGKKLTYGDGATNFNFEIGKNSTGILAKKSDVDLKAKTTLKLTGENSVGIYLDSDKTNKVADIAGKIEFGNSATKSVGVYALNGTTVNELFKDIVTFGTSKNNIGYYIAGSEWKGNGNVTDITYNHNSNNIFIYAQGSKATDGTILGSTVKPYNAINVNPTGTSTAAEKAIGIYLDTSVKGEVGQFVDNDLNLEEGHARINVTKEGIGVYAKNESTDRYNKITLPKITSADDKTVGVYTDGNLKLVRTGDISASNKSIGIYANKGKIVLEDVQRIKLATAGTGIYLTNGTYLDGNKIELKNNTTGTPAAGVYYTKGSSTTQVNHNTEIEVNDGNDALALYVDGGIDLKNNKAITISKNKGNVAAFITGNSKFTNNGNIALEGANLTQALGVYVQDGEATNLSGKTIKVKDETAGSLSVGMAAVKSATGTKAIVNNAGTIEATGDAIAMYVDDNSSGTNSGTISAKNSGNMKAIGAYIKGNAASFKNTGSISSDNIALALDGTTAGKITGGTLNLTESNAVGVYAKDSIIDFDVAPTIAAGKEKTVALFAQGNTKIRKTVTSAAGKGHVGVYVKDSNVGFETGSKVVVNNGSGTDFGVGIYTDKAFNGNINTTIEQNGSETIGLFLGSDGGTGSTVNYTGNIKVGNGIGVYVPTDSKFVATNTTFDVNGGTAVFLKGGAVDLGATGKATINFGTAGGTAIYQDGGTINTGTGLTINGNGSFLALKNANSTINSSLKVGTNGIGINSTYDKTGSDYQLSLGSAGKIQLNGDKATGIAATVTGVSPNKVTIKNEGTIETTAGKQTVGIFAKGAHVENAVNAKINIGEKGIAIFATNEGADANTKLENKGELNLLGNEAIGILANKINTTEAITAGKISGTKDSLIGVYVKESAQATEVKDFTISLGNHAKGLVFDGGKDFTVSKTSTNNKVTIGNTTDKAKRGIGIAAIGTSGVVNNTDITVGTDSLGLYAKDGKITFNSGTLKSSTGSSILAYADKAGEIELNGTGKLSVGTNGIALGTNGGKIGTNVATLVEVNGTKGIGAFVVGDATNAGEISNKFEVKVKRADGIGVYAKGNVTSFAKVTEIKGSNSKGYIFDNLTNAATVTSPLELNDSSATDQIGVYATGTGAGLTTSGISVRGLRNIGIYNKANQNITNNGVLTVGDSTADNSSIGIFSDNSTENTTARTIATNDLVAVGKNSVGIYGKNIGVTQTSAAKDVTVASKGIGILVENTAAYFGKGDISVTGKVNVGADEAIGVQVENANVTLSNDLTVGTKNSKGVFSTGKGNINTSGNLTVGADSIGIYKKGTGSETVRTSSGKTLAVGEKAYGIFADKANVDSNTNMTVAKDGKGIYAKDADLSSVGNVTVGESGIGLYLKSDGTKTLRSAGVHTIGDKKAIGLYVENANIETKAGSSMIIGEGDSVGVFSKGTGNITTNGDITVGKSSIGIYKDGKGNLNIGSLGQNLNIAEKGYGLYYIGAGKTESKIQSNMNMILGKESVGTYAKGVSVVQDGDITVGETTIGSDGYANPDSNKNSIGIFADTSDVSYKGTMLVDKPLSVGIYGKGAGSITLRSGATLNVRNGGVGIMTGQGVSAINIENGATINVSGKAKDVDSNAGDKNVSFGITAYSGIIDNKGTINVSGGATGIYLGGTASLLNGATGTIIVDPVTGGTGLGKPSTKTEADIGGLRITDAGEVTIGNKVITGGTVKIKGDLSMNGMGLDVSTGKVLIDAQSISGTAYILPNFSKGNSEQKITIKDVFKVSPGGIGAFSGDIKSKSVSWIAKISKEFGDTTTKDITLARIPYNSLITGNKYKNLAAGLEEFRLSVPSTQNSEIFKSLDKISDHGTFGKAVADLRGDIYSNIQERMKTVENVYEKSYSELLDSYNVTKDVNKFSVIHSQGKHKDSTLGVTGYKYKSYGVLYLNDREAYSYGGKYGWSAGIIGSNFDFEGRTNKGSSEKVISGKVGLHYQKALDRKDDDAQLKYLSRLELTVNKHKAKRDILIGRDVYHNRASYYSADLSWKNKVFYDYDVNTKWSLKPYAALDLSYGHIWNISENGNGIRLDVKGKDYFVVSPNVGIETKYIIPVGETNRVVVKADAKASYDVTELYEKTNTAKIKGTSSGYYDLSRPEKRRAEGKVGVEIGLEKTDNYGVTLRAEYTGSSKSDMNYGVRFNYKF